MEIEQVFQLAKCEVLRTVTRAGHCIIYELIFTINQLQGDEMADAMEVMENAGDAMEVMENVGENLDIPAQQSEFPMQGLSQQTRLGRVWKKCKHNSDSTCLYDFPIRLVNLHICKSKCYLLKQCFGSQRS